jgi:adenine-specific DNA-methyltransferase
MDTEYGIPIRDYLTTRVTLLRIHRFDPSESLFEDALVSSTTVFFRNAPPTEDHKVNLSFGGMLSAPAATSWLKLSQLKATRKWGNLVSDQSQANLVLSETKRKPQIKLSDWFEVKRGIATGANDFFVIPADRIELLQLPSDFLKPILPSSRYLAEDEIDADENGEPLLAKKLYLIDCKLPEEELRQEYPQFWQYLETGMETNVHLRTLCQSRTPWYSQELRPPAPILCKYMGNRSQPGRRPLRFILNHSCATATNAYHLLYPRPPLEALLDADRNLIRSVWRVLNKISTDLFLVEGRTYGGGMFKIEPGELGNIPVGDLVDLLGNERNRNG